jgi:hypothetical protein
MTTLMIKDELAAELEHLSEREQRPLDDLLQSMLDMYKTLPQLPTKEANEALDAMCGMFDDDVTDLSSTVRETMDAFYREKYGRSD